MPSNLTRTFGEGMLVLTLSLAFLVIAALLVPFSTNWRPPLTSEEMSSIRMSEQDLRAYGEQSRKGLRERGSDYQTMAPALLRRTSK